MTLYKKIVIIKDVTKPDENMYKWEEIDGGFVFGKNAVAVGIVVTDEDMEDILERNMMVFPWDK